MFGTAATRVRMPRLPKPRTLPAILTLLTLLAVSWPTAGSAAGADSTGTLEEIEFLPLPDGARPLRLAHEFIDPGTVRLYCDGRLLSAAADFRLRARSGLVIPLRDWQQMRPAAPPAAPSAGVPGLVIVRYRFLPVPVAARRDLRPVGEGPGLSLRPPDGGGGLGPGLTVGAPPGNLQVSGSKTVQVSSGSRRDMTIDQNLRLTIDGQLTSDIRVKAFLADDNLPVVPEGNTEQLKDIDKVLIQMTAPGWQATLGDFVAVRRGTAFGDYQRKLQGMTLTAGPPQTQVEVLAGSPRGLYRTLQIRGQEANQGPYFLGAGSSGSNLFLVAGSERVTLDGQALVRGADRDYTIDYVRGAITFTYRRLITAESTIVVEYEEGEGPYGRTILGAGAAARAALPVGDIPGSLAVRLVRERDDPARLRTGELQETDQGILAAAGDDPDLAVAAGVTQAAAGTGLYDQVVEQDVTIYVHDPTGGDFDVGFYYLGPGRGDYDLDFIDPGGNRIFVHRGPGAGSYRIGRPLDLPQSHSLMTMTAAAGDTAGAHLAGEWDVSSLDRNVLSERDDGNNDGQAARLAASLGEMPVRIGGRGLGRVSLAGFYEDRAAQFTAFQLHKTVFAYDRWGLGDRAGREGFLEEGDRESSLSGGWRAGATDGTVGLGLQRGTLRHGASLRADRTAWLGDWAWGGAAGKHLWQESTAQDSRDPLDIRSTDRRHEIAWLVAGIRPAGHYRLSRWQDASGSGPSAPGFRYEEYGTALAAGTGGVLDWRVGFTRGLADSLRAGAWARERDSRTTAVGVTAGRLAGMRLVTEGTLRRVLQPGGPDQTTRLARLNLAGQWDRTASDWALGYRVDNSRTEVLDRQIVFVGERQGDFNQDGQYVGDGLGEFDLVLAGTDSLVATTGVRADLNWRQGFAFLGKDRWYGAWSLMTLAAIEGRSTTDQVGRLLALEPGTLFDDRAAVLADVTFTQEAAFLKHLRGLDLRGKFDFRQTRDRQYADHPQDRLNRSWQTYGAWNATGTGSLQWRLQRQQEKLSSTEGGASSQRSYDAVTQRAELGWTHTPGPDWRLSVQTDYLVRRDAVSAIRQWEYGVRPGVRSRLRRGWTLQSEVRLADVSGEEPAGTIRPWFFPQPGFNAESSLRLAWEPSRFLTVSASWFGRKQGQRRWQHDVRLESTARF